MTIRNRTYPYVTPPAAAAVPTPVYSATDNPDPQMSDVIRVRTYPYSSPPAAVEVPIPGPVGPAGAGFDDNINSGVKIVENESGGQEIAIWNGTRGVYQIIRITGDAGSETATYIDIP